MQRLKSTAGPARFAWGFATGAVAILLAVLLVAAQQEEPAPRPADPLATPGERPARFLLAMDPAAPFDGTLLSISGQFVALRRPHGSATEIYPAHQVITIWLLPEDRRRGQPAARPAQTRPAEEDNR